MFSENMQKLSPLFVDDREQDADTFIQMLFQSINQIQCHGCPDLVEKEDGYKNGIGPILGMTCFGSIETQICCDSCPYSATRPNPFCYISIDIRCTKPIAESLADPMHEIFIEGEKLYTPQRCMEHPDSKTKMYFKKTPNLLIVKLNRFLADGKNGSFIEYDQDLKLSSCRNEPTTSKKYNLIGVLTRHGPSIRSGHYTADVKSLNGKWYHIDDEKVSEIKVSSAMSKKAFILLYEKRMPLSE
eukprot:gb/GEZJ01006155.1/.p1 GENE.gb/GEZJ01006155.1/~~gb/GEZJ01006155.1/.p1  ORF type:complete len:243 (-),score=20.99 gb/GEZJ01006155.1/:578-1306(-)